VVLNKEKALQRCALQGLFFVDKRFEISNQKLLKDLMDILNMFEILD
jgi:hypothetical protein